MEDILYYIDHFNETANELNIDLDMYSVSYKSKAYGYECKAVLGFYDTNSDKEKTLSEIKLYFANKTINNPYEFFSDMFDGPTDSGEEPYAVSNGGAVTWYVFEDEKYVYKLSSASNDDYFTLTVKENINPSYCGKLTVSEYSGLRSVRPEELKVTLNSYDKGILNITVSNTSEIDIEININPSLYKGEGDDSFVSMNPLNLCIRNDEYIKIKSKEELNLDIKLRDFGKLNPNDYLLKLEPLELCFNLKEAQ